MIAISCSLFQIVQTFEAERAAFTDVVQDEMLSYGELVALAIRCRYTLARLGLKPGDIVACDLGSGRDLAVLLLACWESGLQLKIKQPGTAVRWSRTAKSVKLLVSSEPTALSSCTVQQISFAELGQSTWDRSFPAPINNPAVATVTAGPNGAAKTMNAAALLQSAENFKAAFLITADDTLLSTSSLLTLEGVCISTVIPLALGMHVMLAGETALENPKLFQTAAERATLCEFGAPLLLRLLQDNAVPSLPAQIRSVFCGSSRLLPADVSRAKTALGRPLQRGYGTLQTGYWAVVSGTQSRAPNYVGAIRDLRSPIRLLGAEATYAGEIVLHPVAYDAPAIRTGDVGWLTPSSTLEVAGELSDVSVRGGKATLLTDLDRLLSGNASVRESRTFREQGVLPTEPVICVCVTEASEASVRDWLIDKLEPEAVPNRIITLPASACNTLPSVDTLRLVASGRAGQAVVAALTARRFRRNPAHNEGGLVAATNAALLSGQRLEFLMFWGCGPRRHAAGPDRAAIDALGELLASAEAAAPLQAHARIICTDVHATNNGHAESHFSAYFSEIRSMAATLDVSFELESAVWRRGGLTQERIVALEQRHEFEQRWRTFSLQSRFVQQATRHSSLADKTAAARHYYATCLLERDLLKSLFAQSVFLTYNGPEFNECFPDLPTLYVYPGARGRNNKPWFVDVEKPHAVRESRVAAE